METVGAGPIVSSSMGAIAGAFVNYFLNYYYTFHSNHRHSKAIVQFYMVAGSGFMLNALFMWIFTNVLSIFYLAAQLITTGLVLIWNFWLNRTWTFRTRIIESDGP